MSKTKAELIEENKRLREDWRTARAELDWMTLRVEQIHAELATADLGRSNWERIAKARLDNYEGNLEELKRRSVELEKSGAELYECRRDLEQTLRESNSAQLLVETIRSNADDALDRALTAAEILYPRVYGADHTTEPITDWTPEERAFYMVLGSLRNIETR